MPAKKKKPVNFDDVLGDEPVAVNFTQLPEEKFSIATERLEVLEQLMDCVRYSIANYKLDPRSLRIFSLRYERAQKLLSLETQT